MRAELVRTIGIQFDGLLEQMKKLELLAKHYDAMEGVRIKFELLALKMAFDLVPGFQFLYDHPVARAANLPNAYRGKTKPKGKGDLPEEFTGDMLKFLFRAVSAHSPTRASGKFPNFSLASFST
jgi:hypothetical protein